MSLDKIKDLVKNPHWPLMYLLYPALRFVPDKAYLSFWYWFTLHHKINWDNPTKFTEKIQWLKLYDRNPRYTELVDKYEVKRIVGEKIGNEHVIPTLGVWNRFDDIDFSLLPNSFILKTTHDSGGRVICFDKEKFDFKAAKKKLEKRMSISFYWQGREWAYKNVRPRIIAEPLIESLGRPDSIEYKLTCFDGKVKVVTVCKGVAHDAVSNRTNDHFDRDLKPLQWYAYYKNSSNGELYDFPPEISEIIEFAELLSLGIPQVRVDFYLVDHQVLFGEMTFYTWGGLIKFCPTEWDYVMGEWLSIDKVKKDAKK